MERKLCATDTESLSGASREFPGWSAQEIAAVRAAGWTDEEIRQNTPAYVLEDMELFANALNLSAIEAGATAMDYLTKLIHAPVSLSFDEYYALCREALLWNEPDSDPKRSVFYYINPGRLKPEQYLALAYLAINLAPRDIGVVVYLIPKEERMALAMTAVRKHPELIKSLPEGLRADVQMTRDEEALKALLGTP